jgi:site-specific DNA-methyltransferase (adenine-specific)
MELNRIYKMDCLNGMEQLDKNSIDLIFTSPPYGVGIEYGNGTIDDVPSAVELTLNMAKKTERILVEGGKLLINVPHGIFRNPYYPFEGRIETQIFDNTKLNYRGKILWFKGYLAGKTAWGSWKSPRDPVLRDYSESILVFCKGKSKESNGRETDLTSDDFLESTKTIWRITPETDNPHPAPFPLELPRTAIKLYTFVGDVVLDPFAGSGTTLVAAKQLQRNYIGFDINSEYIEMAEKRLAQNQLFNNSSRDSLSRLKVGSIFPDEDIKSRTPP